VTAPGWQARFPVETGLLLALCFFLPLAEAPKNLLWLAYLVVWAVNRIRSRDAGGPWDRWDTLFALWIASGFLAAAFAGLHKSEWRGAGDLLRYASILWLVKRGGYSARELRALLTALVLSAVVGLAYGYLRIWAGAGLTGKLQLHSVGHVNHTALYIAIMLGVCTSWLFARWQRWNLARRLLAAAVELLVLVSLVVTESRGALAVGLALVLLLALAWWPRWRVPLAASAAGAFLVVALAVVLHLEVVRKHEQNVIDQNVLAFRDAIWRTSLAAWERYPLFGVGMDNYSAISLEEVRRWRTEAGKDFDPKRYSIWPHAHSLYANTLAERGAVGLAALAAVLLAWLAALVRRRPARSHADAEALFWGASASSWFVTAVGGAFNTTLHHEHGILATLLLGIWLCAIQARARAL
jgi:O-antigen ligase